MTTTPQETPDPRPTSDDLPPHQLDASSLSQVTGVRRPQTVPQSPVDPQAIPPDGSSNFQGRYYEEVTELSGPLDDAVACVDPQVRDPSTPSQKSASDSSVLRTLPDASADQSDAQDSR